MSKLDRLYWKWDNTFNDPRFSLDTSITDLLKNSLIIQNQYDPSVFKTVDPNITGLQEENGQIRSLTCKYPLQLLGITIDHPEITAFKTEVDKVLEPVDNMTECGDYLCVLFRDFYASTSILTRKE